MAGKVLCFYELLADHFHLIFDDWDKSIERQAGILNPLLAAQGCGHPLKILDCACGIGTQALGFATFGHRVVASDLSRAAVNRARREAESRGLDISFHVSDMTSLKEIADRDFDVVAALDNALPHLTPDQLVCAIKAVGSKLKSNGLFLASIRDYDALILQKPTMQPPAFYGTEGNGESFIRSGTGSIKRGIHCICSSPPSLTRRGLPITSFRSIALYSAVNSPRCCNRPASRMYDGSCPPRAVFTNPSFWLDGHNRRRPPTAVSNGRRVDQSPDPFRP